MHCRVWSGKKIIRINFHEIPLPEQVDPKADLKIWALVFNISCTKQLEQAAVLNVLLNKVIEWKSDLLPS